MARADDAVQVDLSSIQDGAHGGRGELVQGMDVKVSHSLGSGHLQGGGHGGGGGLKADPQHDHLELRRLARQGQGIEGRVDDAHVGAGSACLLQAALFPRHAHHIAKGSHGDAGEAG